MKNFIWKITLAVCFIFYVPMVNAQNNFTKIAQSQNQQNEINYLPTQHERFNAQQQQQKQQEQQYDNNFHNLRQMNPIKIALYSFNGVKNGNDKRHSKINKNYHYYTYSDNKKEMKEQQQQEEEEPVIKLRWETYDLYNAVKHDNENNIQYNNVHESNPYKNDNDYNNNMHNKNMNGNYEKKITNMLSYNTERTEDIGMVEGAIVKPQQDANKSFRLQLSNLNEPVETKYNNNNNEHNDKENNNNDRYKRNNMRQYNEIATKKSTACNTGCDDNNNNKKHHNNNDMYYNNGIKPADQRNNGQLLSASLLHAVSSPQLHFKSDDVLIEADKQLANVPLSSQLDNDSNFAYDEYNNYDDDDDAVEDTDIGLNNNELNMHMIYGIQNVDKRKKRAHHLQSASYQSLCATQRQVIPLESEVYEYRPPSYIEVKCSHHFMPNFNYDPAKNRICSEAGFYCIQLNRTIQLIRRKKITSAECWESEMRIVPSGCECMWPQHNYGNIIAYHEQPQKRIRPPNLLITHNMPQATYATRIARSTDTDWQMLTSKELTLIDSKRRDPRLDVDTAVATS